MKREALAPSCAFALLVGCASAPPPAPPQTTAGAVAPSRATPTLASGAFAPAPSSVKELAKGAIMLDDLGSYHLKVTASPAAQAWFDQGLRLTYGFNHDEATRSFARGAELDPGCAMCFWGAALTMGPNYNVPMLPDRARAAWDALSSARAAAPRTSAMEQALVDALANRYKGPEPLEPPAMQPFNVAYADAMRKVAKSYPDDRDVQVLFAESLMDVNPWKLWSLDGKPADGTTEIVSTLEGVLARDPSHPGANHYYIHAVEASLHPEAALPSAERLSGLMPGAGHIVHMPAHIFQRVGRYADASAANARAAEVDHAYMRKTEPPGYYPMYLGHNYGFLAFSASMEGRSADSLAAARAAAKAIPPAMIDMMPGMDFFVSEPSLAMVRFGKWDDLLKEPRPDPKYPVLTAFWLHGHGMALAAKGRLDDAAADHAALVQLAASVPETVNAGNNRARDVFAVAAKVLEARIASERARKAGKAADALGAWQEAVALSDTLAYSEPDDWFYPVRHHQGAAQLAAGKAKDAEATYREDLRRHPKNGWALFGLWQALAQQKRAPEAAAARREFDAAWAKGDVKLTSSAF